MRNVMIQLSWVGEKVEGLREKKHVSMNLTKRN